jgi:fibronectin type 3 domain-containing protein
MKFIFLIFFLPFSNALLAQKEQKEQNIVQGATGNYIFLEENSVGQNFKSSNYDYITISCDIDGSWKLLQTVQGAKTANEFVKIVGDNVLTDIGILKKIKSNNEVWNYIQNNGAIKNFGLYAFSENCMQALGTLYIHYFDTKKYMGKTIHYKIAYFKNNKQIKQSENNSLVSEKLFTNKPSLLSKSEKDSLVQAKWFLKKINNEPIIYGNVYKLTTDGKAQLVSKILALIPNTSNDSILFNFSERVKPGQLFSYYLVPANYANLEGTPSDTISLFSINFEKINQVNNLKATDTFGGIYLSFLPPPASPIITGIIVQRSRYDKTGYANIDTIPPTATHYLDNKLIPNVSYYYQLRTISIRQLPLMPTTWAGATHLNKNEILPLPPSNISATPTTKGVLIKWQPSPQADNGGYRIYRANNVKDSLTAISLITQENEFLDTTALDNRHQYTYAITSINYSQVESAFSENAFASPVNNIVVPNAPTGLSASAENNRVMLYWKNMQTTDKYIKGYNIYKKELLNNEKLVDKVWKSVDLLKAGFKVLNSNIIEASTYINQQEFANDRCAYYITAVDDNGIESEAINPLIVNIPKLNIMPPGNFSARKISAGIALSWDKTAQENITNFAIYKRLSNETKATLLIKLDKNTEAFTDKLIQKNKTYYYSIISISKLNNGLPSAEKGVFVE